jgi:hypothetical protein
MHKHSRLDHMNPVSRGKRVRERDTGDIDYLAGMSILVYSYRLLEGTITHRKLESFSFTTIFVRR